MKNGPIDYSKKLVEVLDDYIKNKSLEVGRLKSDTEKGMKDIQSFIIEFIEHLIALNKDENQSKSNSNSKPTPTPLKLDEDINCIDMPLLHYACKKGWNRVVAYLLHQFYSNSKDVDMDLNKHDGQGKTFFDYAKKNPQVMEVIVEITQSESLSSEDDQFYKDVEFMQGKVTRRDIPSPYQSIISAMDPKHPNIDVVMEYIEFLAKQKDIFRPPLAPIHYLCLQGGGAKGAAYIGTIKAMEETGTLQEIKIVAGASAGALSALMIGLGLTAQQIEELGGNLDLKDVLDYDPDYGSRLFAPITGFSVGFRGGHSGDNVWYYIASILEQITGKHDITFAEYDELCKNNPHLKQMIFTATDVSSGQEQKSKSQIFSVKETPNVRIVDAVRASMSVPGLFKPHKVYEVIDVNSRECQIKGFYIDGGVLWNFPIEIFDDAKYQDPHYPLINTQVSTKKTIQRNPCTVALSLCAGDRLDPMITPLSEEQLKKFPQAHKNSEIYKTSSKSKEEESTVMSKNQDFHTIELPEKVFEDLEKDWGILNILEAAAKYKGWLGYEKAEQTQQKYYTYPNQICQIYDEKVGLTDFNLNRQKRQALEGNGYSAWMRWYNAKRDPSLVCENEDEVFLKFQEDLKVKDEQGQIVNDPTVQQVENHYLSLFTEYYATILNESKARKNSGHDLLQNQKIKFYAAMLMQAMGVYDRLLDDKKAQKSTHDMLNSAFERAIQQNKEQTLIHHKATRRVTDDSQVIKQLKKLLSTDNLNHEYAKAVKLFQGKITNIFKYLEDSHGEILAIAIQTGDPDVVEEMLGVIKNRSLMILQTGRTQRYSSEAFLNEINPVSFFKYAFDVQKSRGEIISLLLKNKIDPLKEDENGKCAFHYAIDAGDVNALKQLSQWHHQNQHQRQALSDLTFGTDKDTLGHYLIQYASENVMFELLQTKNLNLLKTLVSTTKTNHHGVTAAELAADISLNDNVTKNNWTLKYLKNECAMQSSISDLGAHIENYGKRYENHKQLRTQHLKDIQLKKNNILKLDVSQLTMNECLDILTSPHQNKENFLRYCIKINNPKLNVAMLELLLKISPVSRYELLTTKVQGKNSLFIAAENNNILLLEYFINLGVSVAEGPIDNPSALTAAAKAGAMDAVKLLLKTTSSRRVQDKEGKTVIHWLAQSEDPKAPGVLSEAFQRNLTAKDLHLVSSIPDITGNTPLYYLLKNPHAKEMLTALLKTGKGTFTTWKLEDYFDFTTKHNGYNDLEWAYKINPELAEFIVDNIGNSKLAKMTFDDEETMHAKKEKRKSKKLEKEITLHLPHFNAKKEMDDIKISPRLNLSKSNKKHKATLEIKTSNKPVNK